MSDDKKKLKITRIVHGQGVTKNTGNYESVRVYNEIEAEIQEGESVKDVQAKLREAVAILNQKDFETLLG